MKFILDENFENNKTSINEEYDMNSLIGELSDEELLKFCADSNINIPDGEMEIAIGLPDRDGEYSYKDYPIEFEYEPLTVEHYDDEVDWRIVTLNVHGECCGYYDDWEVEVEDIDPSMTLNQFQEILKDKLLDVADRLERNGLENGDRYNYWDDLNESFDNIPNWFKSLCLSAKDKFGKDIYAIREYIDENCDLDRNTIREWYNDVYQGLNLPPLWDYDSWDKMDESLNRLNEEKYILKNDNNEYFTYNKGTINWVKDFNDADIFTNKKDVENTIIILRKPSVGGYKDKFEIVNINESLLKESNDNKSEYEKAYDDLFDIFTSYIWGFADIDVNKLTSTSMDVITEFGRLYLKFFNDKVILSWTDYHDNSKNFKIVGDNWEDIKSNKKFKFFTDVDYKIEPFKESLLKESSDDEARQLAFELEKYINKSLWVDLVDYKPTVGDCLKISFVVDGDWKHDHLYFNTLVEDFFMDNDIYDLWKIDEKEIGNSESDTYESYHIIYACRKEKLTQLQDMAKLFNESYDTSTVGDMVDGYIGNMSEYEIDRDIKLFRRIQKAFKLSNMDDIYVVISDGEECPCNYNSEWFNCDIYEYKDGVKRYISQPNNIDIFVQELNGNYFLFFKDENEADRYLTMVDGINNGRYSHIISNEKESLDSNQVLQKIYENIKKDKKLISKNSNYFLINEAVDNGAKIKLSSTPCDVPIEYDYKFSLGEYYDIYHDEYMENIYVVESCINNPNSQINESEEDYIDNNASKELMDFAEKVML